jgi:hypothetical protein
MEQEVGYFMCFKHELERINEGLNLRNIDANSVISITDNGSEIIVWYNLKTNKMKQTAVEWLEERYKNNINLMNYDFDQAKEMVKQQIIDAYIDGYSAESWNADSEKYYNETFNK